MERHSLALIRFSVPEDHYLCLWCSSSDRSNVVWTRGDQEILVTPQTRRYHRLSNGGLCLLKLDRSDTGEYRCGGQLEAELQVLTGTARYLKTPEIGSDCRVLEVEFP